MAEKLNRKKYFVGKKKLKKVKLFEEFICESFGSPVESRDSNKFYVYGIETNESEQDDSKEVEKWFNSLDGDKKMEAAKSRNAIIRHINYNQLPQAGSFYQEAVLK